MVEDLAVAATVLWLRETTGQAEGGREGGRGRKMLLKLIHLYPLLERPREFLEVGQAAWGGGGGGQTLWGRTTSKGLPLEWEDAIGRCRRAAAAGEWEKASGEYCAVLGRVKEGWVDGWREWAEVVLKWKGGAAAKKIWRFVLREMGSVLSPVGKVGGEGGREDGRVRREGGRLDQTPRDRPLTYALFLPPSPPLPPSLLPGRDPHPPSFSLVRGRRGGGRDGGTGRSSKSKPGQRRRRCLLVEGHVVEEGGREGGREGEAGGAELGKSARSETDVWAFEKAGRGGGREGGRGVRRKEERSRQCTGRERREGRAGKGMRCMDTHGCMWSLQWRSDHQINHPLTLVRAGGER